MEPTQRSDRSVLKEWIVEALESNEGHMHLVQVAKYIWEHHRNDLRRNGDLFYTWQYDMRWAAMVLRKQGILKPTNKELRGIWELNR